MPASITRQGLEYAISGGAAIITKIWKRICIHKYTIAQYIIGDKIASAINDIPVEKRIMSFWEVPGIESLVWDLFCSKTLSPLMYRNKGMKMNGIDIGRSSDQLLRRYLAMNPAWDATVDIFMSGI